jgi:hypothetical protein
MGTSEFPWLGMKVQRHAAMPISGELRTDPGSLGG